MKELFQREEHLIRSIKRREERYAELTAAATSAGSFRYDQEKATGSMPDGSRQESIVIRMTITEAELRENRRELGKIQQAIRMLTGKITLPRIRRLMKYRHVDHHTPEECMEHFGLTFDTYKVYHKKGISIMQKNIDSVPQI